MCLSAVDKIRGLTLTKTFVLSDAISNFLWWYHKKNLLTTPLVCTQQHMAAIKINIWYFVTPLEPGRIRGFIYERKYSSLFSLGFIINGVLWQLNVTNGKLPVHGKIGNAQPKILLPSVAWSSVNASRFNAGDMVNFRVHLVAFTLHHPECNPCGVLV